MASIFVSKALEELVRADLEALECGLPEGPHVAAAFEKLMTELPGSLGKKNAVEMLDDCISAFWGLIASSPGEFVAWLTPEVLESTQSIRALEALVREMETAGAEALKKKAAKGGRIMAAALRGILHRKSSARLSKAARAELRKPQGSVVVSITALREAARRSILTLFEWFGDHFLTERLGMREVWDACQDFPPATASAILSVHCSPLVVATENGDEGRDFLELIVSKGANVNGSFSEEVAQAPACWAFCTGNERALETFIAHGLDVCARYSCGTPAFIGMIDRIDFVALAPDTKERRYRMMKRILEVQPEAVKASCKLRPATNTLRVAIAMKGARLVDIILEAPGGREQVVYNSTAAKLDSSNLSSEPTVCWAVRNAAPEVVRLLVTKYGLMDDWRAKYNAQTCMLMANVLARCSMNYCRMIPSVPDQQRAPVPEALEVLDIMLKAGFIYLVADDVGWNVVVFATWPSLLHVKPSPYVEEDVIQVLRKYIEAGCDIRSSMAAPPRVPQPHLSFLNLAMQRHGGAVLIDFAIEEAGCDVNYVFGQRIDTTHQIPATALVSAIQRGRYDLAIRLIERHRATVAFPGAPYDEQPLYLLMRKKTGPSEAAQRLALALLKVVVKADPKQLMLPCYRQGTVTNPINDCVVSRAPAACLEALLTGGLEGVDELAMRLCLPKFAENCAPVSAFQAAALDNNWPALSLLLRYASKELRITKGHGFVGPLVDIVKSAVERGGALAPPRSLAVVVASMAQEEEEEGSKSAGAKSGGGESTGRAVRVVWASNAFEDPSYAAGAASAAETDAAGLNAIASGSAASKGKKKASKKKGKGKKKPKKASKGSATAAAALVAQGQRQATAAMRRKKETRPARTTAVRLTPMPMSRVQAERASSAT